MEKTVKTVFKESSERDGFGDDLYVASTDRRRLRYTLSNSRPLRLLVHNRQLPNQWSGRQIHEQTQSYIKRELTIKYFLGEDEPLQLPGYGATGSAAMAQEPATSRQGKNYIVSWRFTLRH
jgi:hypothetical protein